MIIAGWSAYPRQLDFERFRLIADEVDAYLMVDMAHFAGLVATGLHPSPVPHAHVTTTTTHKTLGGPRGGVILSNDAAIAKKINSAVFPGQQGGPLEHVIAAKAVAFKMAADPSFTERAERTLLGARLLAERLIESDVADAGVQVLTGGTDVHLVLVDLRDSDLDGKAAEDRLHSIGITVNRNAVPFDPRPPMVTSGLRIGTPGAGHPRLRRPRTSSRSPTSSRTALIAPVGDLDPALQAALQRPGDRARRRAPALPGARRVTSAAGSVRIEKLVTSGTFSLDGGTWDVDNNVWLVGDDDEVIVIDAAHDADAIKAAVGSTGGWMPSSARTGTTTTSTPRRRWPNWTGAPILLHPADAPLWGMTHPSRYPDADLYDGKVITVAGVDVQVLHTPGHSPGSVCLYVAGAGRACSPATRCSPVGRGRPVGRSRTSRRSSTRSSTGC